jgi:hypothetical protein
LSNPDCKQDFWYDLSGTMAVNYISLARLLRMIEILDAGLWELGFRRDVKRFNGLKKSRYIKDK